MEQETKKRLHDIFSAIERIEVHLINCNSYKDYNHNITVKAAVERELGIIGEAMVNIKRVHPELSLTGMQKMISFRNLIIHSYDSVRNDIVWIILYKHVPILKDEVKELLSE